MAQQQPKRKQGGDRVVQALLKRAEAEVAASDGVGADGAPTPPPRRKRVKRRRVIETADVRPAKAIVSAKRQLQRKERQAKPRLERTLRILQYTGTDTTKELVSRLAKRAKR